MAKYNIVTALTHTFLPFVLPPLMSPSQSIRKVRGHHREADTIGLVINPWQAKLWRLGSITTCGCKLLIARWELFSEPSSVHHSFLLAMNQELLQYKRAMNYVVASLS